MLADLSADVVHWCTHTYIVYDNLWLQYYIYVYSAAYMSWVATKMFTKCPCILLAHMIYEINLGLMAVGVFRTQLVKDEWHKVINKWVIGVYLKIH